MTHALLVDTGMGNLRSVARALERAGARVEISGEPSRVRAADRLVVPGQGHFGDFARALAGELGEALRAHVAADRPYLGLCLGMQALFDSSEEAPGRAGLGIVPGRVVRFTNDLVDGEGRRLKVPHMGWNLVEGAHPLLPAQEYFYFVHSYYSVPDDPSWTVASSRYGLRFCAAVAKGALLACQFHPEKSQDAGARLLERWLGGRGLEARGGEG